VQPFYILVLEVEVEPEESKAKPSPKTEPEIAPVYVQYKEATVNKGKGEILLRPSTFVYQTKKHC